MADIEIKFNDRELAALRALPGVASLIEGIVDGWADEANATLPEGVGYRSAVHRDSSRRGPYVVGRVFTSSDHAKRSNAIRNTLINVVRK